MAALSAISSATPSLQISLIRNRLEGARREAEQAQANEQRLRQQVSDAESQTQRSQDKVRSLSNQMNQASQPAFGYASRPQSSQAVVPVKTQEWLSVLYGASSAKRQATDSGMQTTLNSQGQATGRILNLSA